MVALTNSMAPPDGAAAARTESFGVQIDQGSPSAVGTCGDYYSTVAVLTRNFSASHDVIWYVQGVSVSYNFTPKLLLLP
jgi:hypothetical protein